MDVIDEETLRIMISYCGQDPRIARSIEVQVLDEWAEQRWSISEFKEIIDEAINEIPEECRAEAVVDLDGRYEETGRLKITYYRLENDEEIARNVKSAFDYAKQKQAQERFMYEALKKKFE